MFPHSYQTGRRGRFLLLLILLAAGTAVAQPPSRALPLNHFFPQHSHSGPWRRIAVGIADDYFDGTSPPERVRRHFAVARQLGVKYLRCAFSWNAIEKSTVKYDWTFWDNLVSEAQRSGVQLIPYVAYTPEWAASNRDQFWSQPPRDPAFYADFMYQIASRYKGKIHAWEIWNEPDNRDYWRGSVEQYAKLVREAAAQLRRADPSLVLVLGGMSRGPSSFFHELLSRYDVGSYVDVITIHAYPETWDEERAEIIYQEWIPQMSEFAARFAPGTDFWVNEMGYADYRFRPNQASKWGTGVYYDYEHTREYQARFLFKAETMSLASPRVSLTAWYRIDDFAPATTHFSDDEVNYHLGLLDAGGKPKPAFEALRFFQRILGQPTRLLPVRANLPPPSDAEIDVFRRQDSRIVVVAWLRSSRSSEIGQRTGTLHDNRREFITVPIPCQRLASLRSYDVEGHPSASRAAFSNGFLRNVSLTGDDVSITVLTCR